MKSILISLGMATFAVVALTANTPAVSVVFTVTVQGTSACCRIVTLDETWKSRAC